MVMLSSIAAINILQYVSDNYSLIKKSKNVYISSTDGSKFEAYDFIHKGQPAIIVSEKGKYCCEEYMIIHNDVVYRSRVLEKLIFITLADSTTAVMIPITDGVKGSGETVQFSDKGVEFTRGKETIRVIYNTKAE